MSDYRPISCQQHSEYELLAMHRRKVTLQLSGADTGMSGEVVDVLARDGAEYLLLLQADGERHEVRLDRIESVTAVE